MADAHRKRNSIAMINLSERRSGVQGLQPYDLGGWLYKIKTEVLEKRLKKEVAEVMSKFSNAFVEETNSSDDMWRLVRGHLWARREGKVWRAKPMLIQIVCKAKDRYLKNSFVSFLWLKQNFF